MQFEWVRNYPNYRIYEHSSALDSSGNIYSVGDSSSYLKIFKHNSNGTLLWTKELNHRKTNSRLLAATDRNNDLYISFGNINHQFVLVKIDSSGQLKWENVLIYGGYDEPYSIAVDKAGFIYLTGETFNGTTKCLTVKYTPQGDTLWARINPEYVMGGNYISLDDSGYVYVAGGYISSGGSYYYGTLKYDNKGNLKWFSKYRYQNTISRGICVRPDNKGNCYVSGYISLYNGTFISGLIKYDYKGDSVWVRVFGDSLTESFASTNIEMDENNNIYLSCAYLMKYDENGNLLWSKKNNPRNYTFIKHNNSIFSTFKDTTNLLNISAIDYNGSFLYSQQYPNSIWGYQLLSKKNSIYLMSFSVDSLILIKFTTPSINIMNNTTILNDFKLYQNYPNPFNPVTKINYELPNDGKVKLMIYDVLGREIKTLVNEVKQAGKYTVEFNGHNFASGVYFYRIESGKFTEVKRMVLVK